MQASHQPHRPAARRQGPRGPRWPRGRAPGTGDPLLQLVDLTRRFGDKRAVDRASVTIADGEMVGIIGRSGAGKSTLLRLINRLIDPSEGTILCDGTDVTALRGKELRAWRARTAMIFQQFNLVNRLDVLTNVHVRPAVRNSRARACC